MCCAGDGKIIMIIASVKIVCSRGQGPHVP